MSWNMWIYVEFAIFWTEVLTPSKWSLCSPTPRRWHWRPGAHGTLYSVAPVPGPKHRGARYSACPKSLGLGWGVAWQLRWCFLLWLCVTMCDCTGGISKSLTICESVHVSVCLSWFRVLRRPYCWLLANRAGSYMAAHSQIMKRHRKRKHLLCAKGQDLLDDGILNPRLPGPFKNDACW